MHRLKKTSFDHRRNFCRSCIGSHQQAASSQVGTQRGHHTDVRIGGAWFGMGVIAVVPHRYEAKLLQWRVHGGSRPDNNAREAAASS
jgi:hypothetical protein